jgi:hypothetical protein
MEPLCADPTRPNEVTADNPCERYPTAKMIITVDEELDSKSHGSRHNSD